MTIRIDGKIPEGYVLLCDAKHSLHSFVVKNLGPAIECPKCGTTALSTNLVRQFYQDLTRQSEEAPGRVRLASYG